MLVRSNLVPNREFHLPDEVAQPLIMAGVLEEVVPPPKKIGPPKTRWTAGFISGEHGTRKLVIQGRCETCKQHIEFEGTVISDEPRYRFWHCAVGETIPNDVLKAYKRLLPQAKEEQRRPKQTGDAVRRLFLIGDHGEISDKAGETQYIGSNPEK